MSALNTGQDPYATQPLIPGVRGGLSARQLWLIVLSRKNVIIGVALAFLVLTAIVSLLMSKVYESEVSLLIAFQDDDPVTGRSSQQFIAEKYFATQIDLMQSRRVRARVVEELGLANDPEAREKFEATSTSGASFSDWLAARLLKKMSIETSRESRILSIAYQDEDPQMAADLANATARAYRDISLNITEDPARQRQSRYTEYLASLRADVEAAQKKLTDLRQELQVLNVSEFGRQNTERLDDLGVRLNQAQAERQAAQARVRRIRELKRSGKPLTAQADILESRFVQELKGRLVELETLRSELGETLGANHPRMQSLSSEIATVRRRLGDEINAYIEADRGEAQSASDRESALRQTLEAERSDVLEVQRKRDQLANYERELEAAKHIHDAAVENYDQVLGGSQLQQTNVSILHWASPPEYPVRPNIKLNLVAGLLLGLFAGLTLALLLELSSRRIRGDEDIERELNLDVLGVIPG